MLSAPIPVQRIGVFLHPMTPKRGSAPFRGRKSGADSLKVAERGAQRRYGHVPRNATILYYGDIRGKPHGDFKRRFPVSNLVHQRLSEYTVPAQRAGCWLCARGNRPRFRQLQRTRDTSRLCAHRPYPFPRHWPAAPNSRLLACPSCSVVNARQNNIVRAASQPGTRTAISPAS